VVSFSTPTVTAGSDEGWLMAVALLLPMRPAPRVRTPGTWWRCAGHPRPISGG